ncbi:MAG: sugar phosphate isomerase/epimerase [Acholeplasmataceae bacterium]|nr:sugar phosphate isomerase/epimerase [Acholeplasmataceae bacterium]
MKLGIQTDNIINIIGLEAGFASIRKAGFTGVDFGLYNYDIGVFFDETKLQTYFQEVKACAKANNLVFYQFHAPFPSYIHNDLEATQKIRAAIIKSIEITSECNSPYLIVHPCYGLVSKEEEWEENIRFYSSLIPHLKKHRITCCLENLYFVCSDANEANKYIDTLNEIAGEDLFGFCLDIGHLLLNGKNPYEEIKALGKRLKALHIHDNDGRNDLHLSPYLGKCNWVEFCEALKECDYQGVLSFETGSTQVKFPREVHQEVLNLIGAIGSYFSDRISKK